MKNQYHHLTDDKQKDLLNMLQKYKELFYVTVGLWKSDTVDIELKKVLK